MEQKLEPWQPPLAYFWSLPSSTYSRLFTQLWSTRVARCSLPSSGGWERPLKSWHLFLDFENSHKTDPPPSRHPISLYSLLTSQRAGWAYCHQYLWLTFLVHLIILWDSAGVPVPPESWLPTLHGFPFSKKLPQHWVGSFNLLGGAPSSHPSGPFHVFMWMKLMPWLASRDFTLLCLSHNAGYTVLNNCASHQLIFIETGKRPGQDERDWNATHGLWLFWSLPFLPLLSFPLSLPKREEGKLNYSRVSGGERALWSCSNIICTFVRSVTRKGSHC